jgi:hypothetical protein
MTRLTSRNSTFSPLRIFPAEAKQEEESKRARQESSLNEAQESQPKQVTFHLRLTGVDIFHSNPHEDFRNFLFFFFSPMAYFLFFKSKGRCLSGYPPNQQKDLPYLST